MEAFFSGGNLYSGVQARPLAVDERASVWPGCRPTVGQVWCHGLCPWGSTGVALSSLSVLKKFFKTLFV